jgi:hypothetical protein
MIACTGVVHDDWSMTPVCHSGTVRSEHAMSDQIKKVYSAFDPAPLRADKPEQRDLYVCLDDVRGQGDVVHRLAEKIRLSSGPTCQILAGHKGSGKSTELRRLKYDMEQEDERYFVVLVESDRDIDRNDVDFLEVLIAIMRQTAIQLEEHAGIKLKLGYFRDRLKRIKNILGSSIQLDGADLHTPLANLALTIKGSPDTRQKLREAIEPDTGNWLYAANDLLGDAVSKLKDKGYQGIVILVDDLDKMVLRPHPQAGCSTAEYLFVHRQPQLAGFECHTVYTMPLALAYSTTEQTIASLYEGHVPVVPMVRIGHQPPDESEYKPGLERLRDIVLKRLKKIGAQENDVFSSGVLDSLVRWSGGQPTELMYFIREAIITAFPITNEALERPIRERRRAFARELRFEHWPVIEEVRKTGRFTRSKDNDEIIRELLDSRAILQYVNHDEWYDLNPVIADMSNPANP